MLPKRSFLIVCLVMCLLFIQALSEETVATTKTTTETLADEPPIPATANETGTKETPEEPKTAIVAPPAELKCYECNSLGVEGESCKNDYKKYETVCKDKSDGKTYKGCFVIAQTFEDNYQNETTMHSIKRGCAEDVEDKCFTKRASLASQTICSCFMNLCNSGQSLYSTNVFFITLIVSLLYAWVQK